MSPNPGRGEFISALGAILDPGQRSFRAAEQLERIEPALAARLFGRTVEDAFDRREPAVITALHAIFMAILHDQWPSEHRRRTREEAAAAGDEVTLAFLVDSDYVELEEDDDAPDYGMGRPLTLGERKSLAARPSRGLIERALLDPHPDVVAKMLSNPFLTEDDAVRMAARAKIRRSALVNLSTDTRWRTHRRVLFALASNPRTPPPHGTTLLPFLLPNQVEQVRLDHRLSATLRSCAGILLDR